MHRTLLLLFACTVSGLAQSADLTPASNLTSHSTGADLLLPPSYEAPPLPKALGFEGATGIRSSYLYRGRELTDVSFEFQIHGHFSYTDKKHLEYGLWHLGELGDEDYQESGLLLNYFEQHGDWTFGVDAKFRLIDHDIYDSGVELNFNTAYNLDQDNIFSSEISFDTGPSGFYAKLQYDRYKDLSDRSFLHLQVGLSISHDYYEEESLGDDLGNGFNDFFAKLTYTHNLTQQVSLSPFLSTSIQESEASLQGGIWFETSF